jgi:hypothetical protein
MKNSLHRSKLAAFWIGAVCLLCPSAGPVNAQKLVGGNLIQISVSNSEGTMSIHRVQSPDKIQRSGQFPVKAALGKGFLVVPFKLTRAKSVAEAFLEDSGKQQIKQSALSNGSELVFEVPRGFSPARLVAKGAGGSEWQFAEIRKLISN